MLDVCNTRLPVNHETSRVTLYQKQAGFLTSLFLRLNFHSYQTAVGQGGLLAVTERTGAGTVIKHGLQGSISCCFTQLNPVTGNATP
jgi:hypothetical protein